MATVATETPSTSTEHDWTKPQAMAIPKEGYFKLEKGRMGQYFHGLQPAMAFPSSQRSNREERMQSVIMGRILRRRLRIFRCPAPLKFHYLRWILFDIGKGLLHVPGYL